MKKILLIGAFASLSFGGGIPSLTVPIRIDSALIPKVAYIDRNNDSIKDWTNIVKDTLNRRSDTVAYYLDGSGGKTGTGNIVKATGATVSNLTAGGTTTLNNTVNVSGATASQALFTDGSKNVVSNAITGSGNVVMSTSPTITTPTISTPSMSSASITTATLNGTITNSGTISGGTINATTLQQGGIQAVTTTGTQTLTNKSIDASQITAGNTASGSYGFYGANTMGRLQGSQETYTPATSTDPSVRVTSNDLLGGSGGEIFFGASDKYFAAIKGYLQDGNNNSRGDLTFSTRFANTDASLTEALRIGQDGTVDAKVSLKQAGVSVVTTTGTQTLTNKTLTSPAISTATITGATTIASNSSGFYEEGGFTGTWVGFTTSPTSSVYYSRAGKNVSISVDGGGSGTSNSASTYIGTLPSSLRPSRVVYTASAGNADYGSGLSYLSVYRIQVSTGGLVYVEIMQNNTTNYSGAWQSSGSKEIGPFSFSYTIQ